MTSRKLRLGLAALTSLAVFGLTQFAATRAAAQSYRIAPERTLAGFAVTNLGVVRQDGHFNRASGTIVLDPARARGGSVDVTIDLSSVDMNPDDVPSGKLDYDVQAGPVATYTYGRFAVSATGGVSAWKLRSSETPKVGAVGAVGLGAAF